MLNEERYLKQLPVIGCEGQEKLNRASVLVVGAGGLGSPLLYYLAAAGVGSITVMDNDKVTLSNLNRQIIFKTTDVNKLKAPLAATRLSELNDSINIKPITETLTAENAPNIIKGFDILALCADNLKTRLIANAACVRAGIPFVNAGVSGFSGTLTTVIPGETACLSCIYGSAGNNPANNGAILGATAGCVAGMQAMAVIRCLTGIDEPSAGNLLIFDGEFMSLRHVPIKRDQNCAVCSVK